jgi:glycosyltransferase involved in cell wall biosynthesis
MKVVHVETGRHLYGGAQQVIYLVQGLQQRGLDNTIVCLPGSAIDALARQLQLRVHNIDCGGDLDIRFMSRLRRFLTDSQPDIVHCHSRRGADFLGGRAARSSGIPAVLSRRVDSRENKIVSRLRYSGFRKIIAISENVATSLRESSVNPDRIELIRSAVDAEFVAEQPDCDSWKRQFDLPEDGIVAIIVAQLIERKGHRFLLQAMPAICRAQPNFRLIVFGKGPLETALREQAVQLGVADQVRFAGFRDDIDQFLHCADMLVHPALKEGLGVSMLKAAAAGLPVVAFDVAGAREAVVSDKTGLLVKPGDAMALLQAVTHLIENPSMRKQFGSAGRARMHESFSIDEMTSRHIELYESLINNANE